MAKHMHKMPDGSMMFGKEHGAKKAVKSASKKMVAKKSAVKAKAKKKMGGMY